MNLELNEEEKQYLIEGLQAAHKELLQELHFSSTVDYKERLKRRAAMCEMIIGKLQQQAK